MKSDLYTNGYNFQNLLIASEYLILSILTYKKVYTELYYVILYIPRQLFISPRLWKKFLFDVLL